MPLGLAAVPLALTLAGVKTPMFSCPVPPPVKVEVQVSENVAHLDNTHSLDDLRVMANVPPDKPGSMIRHDVGGLMADALGTDTEVHSKTLEDPNVGKGCVWVEAIRVTIAHDKPTIYVARDYMPATCEFNAIYQHEIKHWQVEQAMAQRANIAVKRDLDIMMRRLAIEGPMPVSGLDAARERLSKYVAGTVQQTMNGINDLRRRTQDAVDSPQEYARVQALCKGWKRDFNRR